MYKLRRTPTPYQRQPPAQVKVDRSNRIAQGLTVAAAIPYEPIEVFGHGNVPGVYVGAPTGVAPTFSTKAHAGKTLVGAAADRTFEFAGVGSLSLPLTVMANFRQTTAAPQGTVVAMGGSGDGGGFALQGGVGIVLTLGGIANYNLTGGEGLVTEVEYTVVVTLTATEAIAYLIRHDTREMAQYAPVAVSAMNAPTRTLSLLSARNAVSNVDPLDGDVGAFALWDRVLTNTEAFSLLTNPYQLWSLPGNGEPPNSVSVTVPVTGVAAVGTVGTTSQSGAASHTLTGAAAPGAVGATTQSGAASHTLTGVAAAGTLGTTTQSAAASHTPTGLVAAGAVGSTAQSGAAYHAATGVAATGTLGATTVSLPHTQAVTGTASSASVGQVAITNSGSTPVTGVVGPTGVTDVTVVVRYTIEVVLQGVEATGRVGSAAHQIATSAALDGLQGVFASLVSPTATTSVFAASAGTPGWEALGSARASSWASSTTPATQAWEELPPGLGS